MSYTYFTADLHFGHSNIIKYCNRPLADAESMNKGLIGAYNSQVKNEDTGFHIGGFCFTGRPGGANKASYYEHQLNGKLIHARGNHDRNNTVKGAIECAVIQLGGLYERYRY